MSEQVLRRARRHPADPIGVALVLVTAALYFTMSWVRHRNYWSGAFDLGIFDQGVWQLANGRDTVSLIERRVLADHFSPVLLTFAPLYRLAPTPAWLLAAQSFALGLALLPLRALGRHWGQPDWVPVTLALASAPLLSAALFDMHPSTLAVPFIAWLVLAVARGQQGAATWAVVGIALCRADLAAVVLAMAIVARPGLRLRLVLQAVTVGVVGAVGPGLFGTTSGWGPHFGHLGDGPLDALMNPSGVLSAVASGATVRTLTLWLLAAGVVIVLRPRWLVAVVVAGMPVLLSDWGGTSQPWFHYGAPIAPIAIAGSLDALRRVHLSERWRTTTVTVATLGPMLCLALASPLSPRAPDSARLAAVLRPWPGGDPTAALAEVGPEEVVSASDRLVPHLTHRERVYLYPIPFAPTRNYFAPGSEPDLSEYPPDLVDVVVAPEWLWDERPQEGFRVTHRVDGYVVARPEPDR